MASRTYLDFAESDLAAAKAMLKAGFYDHCARLCQQAVEKYFKHIVEEKGDKTDMGLLVSHKVHQLYDRVVILLSVPLDKAMRSDLATLTDYYFDKNYPGAADSPVELAEAEEALKIATDTINSIGPGLGQNNAGEQI